MTERAFPAVFMRGGTSKALMLLREDLPERELWDEIFVGAMGSPDPYGRQLNGMGGGISSLSKVCVIGRSSRDDADVDYTFAQVLIGEARVDYKGNCGNMSSAVGPFAVEAGLVSVSGDKATVRVFNTNTQKVIHSTFPVINGQVAYEGDLDIPGVSGTGAPIALEFLDPGGATTGRLLPSGTVTDLLRTPGGDIEASLIDAANACVFVAADQVGLKGTEAPDQLDQMTATLQRLAEIREHGSVLMGVAPDLASAAKVSTVPYVAAVSAPQDYVTLDGARVPASAYDVGIRVISNGQPHRACPLTIALCTAVASRIDGTLVARAVGKGDPSRAVKLGTPSGVLTVDAQVRQDESGDWVAGSGSFFRTARRLFEGRVWSRI